mmetsp:Transcript_15023/g.29984  ORF Transcript_15023/g.29984 Transcript_15023/m.29984 type:complete len:204 (-) Transcript_15023:88-699(-)
MWCSFRGSPPRTDRCTRPQAHGWPPAPEPPPPPEAPAAALARNLRRALGPQTPGMPEVGLWGRRPVETSRSGSTRHRGPAGPGDRRRRGTPRRGARDGRPRACARDRRAAYPRGKRIARAPWRRTSRRRCGAGGYVRGRRRGPPPHRWRRRWSRRRGVENRDGGLRFRVDRRCEIDAQLSGGGRTTEGKTSGRARGRRNRSVP